MVVSAAVGAAGVVADGRAAGGAPGTASVAVGVGATFALDAPPPPPPPPASPINTVKQPSAIVSGGPTHTHMSPMRATGAPPARRR